MKKRVNKFLSLLLTLGLIAGCSTTTGDKESAKDGGSSEDKIELRMTWWGSQDRHDRTLKVIELYEEKNPDVKFLLNSQGGMGIGKK